MNFSSHPVHFYDFSLIVVINLVRCSAITLSYTSTVFISKLLSNPNQYPLLSLFSTKTVVK